MKKVYVVSVSVVLALMGIAFLAAPATWLGTLGVQISDPSVMSMIRSFGGFYLGFAAFLQLAARREGGIDMAVLAAALAMAGFLAGRALSLAVERMPDRGILAASAVELVFALWGGVLLARGRAGKA
jgi:hypothetical protein